MIRSGGIGPAVHLGAGIMDRITQIIGIGDIHIIIIIGEVIIGMIIITAHLNIVLHILV
jgi:hypothetical protein